MIPAVYRGLTTAAWPLIHLYLARRKAVGKEDPARFGERLGRASLARPPGPLIWLHAASIGEALSILSLIGRLLDERPGLHILVTTGTVTSARLVAERLPPRAFHQYVPVDRALWVRRFLDHWRPDLALWVESELWPNLVGESQRRGVPMVLVNGRMSARSTAGWQRMPGLVRPLLSGFALCLTQSEEDARRFSALGAARVKSPGNLKYAAAPLAAEPEELSRLRAMTADRPLWLAASTHPGEERVAGQVHRRLAPKHAGLLTLVVPRHATRGAEVARELGGLGLSVARRSAGEAITPATGLYLADTMGELGLFYRLADVVFVGGSLVRHGGQNLLEPAQLGSAVIHGPHMANFQQIVDEMRGASIEVADGDGLADAVDRLLGDPQFRAERAAAAAAVASRTGGVLDAVLAELKPFLEALPEVEVARARA